MLAAISGLLSTIFGAIASIFPQSPFADMFEVTSDLHLGLGWLNWFVPINTFIGILVAWIGLAVAVTAFRVVGMTVGGLGKKVMDGGGLVASGSTEIV